MKKKIPTFTDDEMDEGFMFYLENALIEFEQPHQYDNVQRIRIYKDAFKKAIKQMSRIRER